MNQLEALQRLQAEELDILLAIADFCEKHHICWFLDSGTALGAVRHGGFIPWDDDIDIGMFREDYDKFLAFVEQEGLPNGYSLHTFENTPEYACMFAKVYKDGTLFLNAETIDSGCRQGIFVDIFPYDRLSSDDLVRRKQISNAQIWKNLSFLWHSDQISVLSNNSLIRAVQSIGCTVVHSFLRSLVKRESLMRNFSHSYTSLMPDEDSGNGKRIVFMWASKLQFDEEILLPTSTVSFCGHKFPAPHDVEKYLEMSYGNWEQLPPVDKRHTHLPQVLVFSDGSRWEA